jgi:hypothetical protein
MRRRFRLRSAAALAAAAVLVALSPAQAEVAQRGHLRVSFEGKLTPHVLPRAGTAPVKVSVSGKIATTDGGDPPQLQRITIEINRNGRLDRSSLPVCHMEQIQPASNASAMEACAGAKVGEGSFTANVLLPTQAPFPSIGKVLAFNGVFHGRPAILAHVYGTEPLPTSYTLPFLITTRKRGTFGTKLSASLPEVTSEWGYVTGMSMTLGRAFHSHGSVHAYLSAGCPAPKGFPGATFPLARASFGFQTQTLSATVTRSCGAR